MKNALLAPLRFLFAFLVLFHLISGPTAFSQLETVKSPEVAQGQEAGNIPFELNSEKIYLNVRINDQGPFWLVLDTGSPNLILDTRVAETLSLSVGEPFQVGGAGEKPFSLSPVHEKVDVILPGLRLPQQPAMVGSIDSVVGPFEGRHIDGVIGGFNIFAKFVVEIDYDRQAIHVNDPKSFRSDPDGAIIPISVREGHAFTAATITLMNGDSISCEVILDTGLRGTIVFHTPFVNKHQLLDKSKPTIHATVGGGIGGQVWSYVGRLKSLQIGGVIVPGIHASFSQAKSGLISTDYSAGIIGSAVMQRFRVVFDYPGERMILYPNKFDPDLLDYDKSGMFLVSSETDRSLYGIIDVVKGSPADSAGLQVGDVIREIDGDAADTLSLEQIRTMFRRKAGTKLTIRYKREKEFYSTSLVLRKII